MASATDTRVLTVMFYMLDSGVPDIDTTQDVTVRDAVEWATQTLSQRTQGLQPSCALVFECTPHVVRMLDGSDVHATNRWRLAAQLWLRQDGTIDSRTYQPSESPWGAVFP